MLISDTLKTAGRALVVNKLRSLLTMLGIIIGVGSVVLMVSVGRSFQGYIFDQIDALGGNVIDVYPTGLEKFGASVDSITYDDYLAVKKLTTVESVAPVVFRELTANFEAETRHPLVFGTTKEIFANYGLKIERGRLLTDRDTKGAASVAVLASEIAEELFGATDPIGKRLRLENRFYTVVGTLQSAGSMMMQDLETIVYIPVTTARSVFGQKHLSYMNLRAGDDDELVRSDITTILRLRHGIRNPYDDPDKDDFLVRSTEQATAVVGNVTLGITAFVALIAGISLLVGGIGIMNIMLVSVAERTREIGLRKALGARSHDILFQFLLEAVALTVAGGMIGIAGALGIGFILTQVASKFIGDISFAMSIPAILSAGFMAAVIGVVFGLYPARKAAALSPMEAIRWE